MPGGGPLCSSAGRCAYQRARPDEALSSPRQLVGAMDEVRDLHEFHNADVKFHLVLDRLSGNAVPSVVKSPVMLSSLSAQLRGT